ncbi:mRNA splicing factor SYF2 [Exidia glandulosa HHB12029]|uniref:Pre-mRNA-splicing factor SYF2 n=1 Tax=Exidia glandulosa HHB12029 TaxID=1314781 RepID=A0A165PFG0_EXIGL|nr:mRNA splicing factor SYF2 [Exidia glandulosa HHB12029]
MAEASKANRKELIDESTRLKTSVRDAARQEKQRKLAELLREKTEADETGADVERKKNWAYTIEENDEWEKKLARKKRRADFEYHDDTTTTHRKYKKDLDLLKPNLEAYNRQREVALGLAPGSLKGTPSASQVALIAAQAAGEQGVELLYRDANTLLYADNKPSEEAIDRVTGKLALDAEKRQKYSRKRANEDEGDVTYINERNRVFNKKIARYYDKYTEEIRASFERGTAL